MARSAWLRSVVGLAVAGVVLGACAQSHPPAAVPGGTSSHRSHRPYSDVNPPPRHGGDFTVKVLVLTGLAPGADEHGVHADRTGLEFWGEKVRTCVNRSSHHGETVGWEDWRAQAMDGRTYPADPRDWKPLRVPTYPFHTVLSPGQCATGYWLITVPKGTDIRAIQFAPDDGRVLIEWLTLR
jgi:hypothetical protein